MTVIVTHNKVSAVADSGDTTLVQPSDWNANHTISGLGTAASLDAGVANGVATLDSSGKVPTSQIPLQGDLNYQGAWNASTNSPTLTSSVGTKGYYYVVSVAGTTNLNGITDWQIGDWAIFNGSVWQKVDNTDAVTSVNGYTGTVVLTYSDVGAANAPTNTNITSMSGITGAISSPTSIQMGNGSGTTLAAGKMWYDQTTGSWNMGMGGGNITQQVGEELFIYGKASSAITEGQLIVKTGAVGASGVITFAPSPTGLTDNDGIIGVATENIALNGFGRITTFGVVHGINTTGSSVGETWADGDTLYYNPSYAGGLTNVKPSAPYAKFQIGTVTHAGSGGSGSIQVDLVPGSKLGATDANVQTNGLASGNTLIYDASVGYWKNANLSAGTGISVTNGAGSITIANTAPDQTVAISAGTGISVSGTYPSFTVANSGVTSIAGTASQITASASTGGVTLALANPINVDTSGNAATVTNGVYTTGSYSNPTWITSLAGSKISGTIDGGTF